MSLEFEASCFLAPSEHVASGFGRALIGWMDFEEDDVGSGFWDDVGSD